MLPPDDVLRYSYNAFISTFYTLCPVFKRSVVEDGMARGDHRVEGPLRTLLFAILALIEVATRLQAVATNAEESKMTSPGPLLLRATRQISSTNAFPPYSTHTAAASLLLSIAYHSLGDMQTSLFWMQESITIAQVRLQLHQLHTFERAEDVESCLRLCWMM